MSESINYIPNRIKNAAVGGHVCGADDVIDDITGLTLEKVVGSALEEKEYTSGSNNGMGRVMLHKNLVGGVNTLTQAMMQATNTIYVIQYDFTLGENITIPENCVLEFEGGSISGGFVYGNNTVLIGGNKYKSVLVGLFRNKNGEYVDGTGNILKPNYGFDFAATNTLDVSGDSDIQFAAQGIIHTGEYVFVVCKYASSEGSVVVRYDSNFNYNGFVKLETSQIEHGGIGFYKDGYIYLAAHLNSTVVKYSVTSIISAQSESTISGTVINMPSEVSGNVVFLSYDYNNDTILIGAGNIVICDSNFNPIISKTPDIPYRVGYILQDIKWNNGVITYVFCDYQYERMDPSVLYFDLYSGTKSDIIPLKSLYTNIELEGTCSFIGNDDVYLACANDWNLNLILVGKFSNTKTVDTLDRGIYDNSIKTTTVYVNSTVTKVPYGTAANPYKNIASAIFFNKEGGKLNIKVKDISNTYNLPKNIYNQYLIIEGDSHETNRIQLIGISYFYNTIIDFSFTNYVGNLYAVQHSKVNLYRSTIDGNNNSSEACIALEEGSSLIFNRVTFQNSHIGIYMSTGSEIFSNSPWQTSFVNLSIAIYIGYCSVFNFNRFMDSTFTNVTRYLELSLDSCAPVIELYCLNNQVKYNDYINILDNSTEHGDYRIYFPFSFNDRPAGICTFINKDKVGDTKGTFVGPNGSTLPLNMTTPYRTTYLHRVLLVGDHTFDTDLNKEVYWTGTAWVDGAGNVV